MSDRFANYFSAPSQLRLNDGTSIYEFLQCLAVSFWMSWNLHVIECGALDSRQSPRKTTPSLFRVLDHPSTGSGYRKPSAARRWWKPLSTVPDGGARLM